VIRALRAAGLQKRKYPEISLNGVQIGPGCTSFPSASCPGEVIIQENTGILPEQFTVFRRE